MNNLSGKYICFSLGKEQFAVPLLQVKEVIGNIEATPVPQSPAHFKGIINLRGQIISILDLRINFKIGNASRIDSTIIILDFETYCLGVVVDSVDCVETYNESDISVAAEFDRTEIPNIIGVAKKSNNMTLLLDLKTLLDPDQYKKMNDRNLKIA